MKLVESIARANATRYKKGPASRVPEIVGRLDFRNDGLCRTVWNPDDLFVEGPAAQREAKKICGGCGVRKLCRTYALTNRQEYGVWGGMTEGERRRLLKLPESERVKRLEEIDEAIAEKNGPLQVELQEQAS